MGFEKLGRRIEVRSLGADADHDGQCAAYEVGEDGKDIRQVGVYHSVAAAVAHCTQEPNARVFVVPSTDG